MYTNTSEASRRRVQTTPKLVGRDDKSRNIFETRTGRTPTREVADLTSHRDQQLAGPDSPRNNNPDDDKSLRTMATEPRRLRIVFPWDGFDSLAVHAEVSDDGHEDRHAQHGGRVVADQRR